jgi:chaperonin cofactor prefoldin
MVKQETNHQVMARRAILTETERKYLNGELEEVDSNRASSMNWRIEKKIDQLKDDYELLRKTRPELARQIHDIVCTEDLDERVSRLESEIEQLRNQTRE